MPLYHSYTDKNFTHLIWEITEDEKFFSVDIKQEAPLVMPNPMRYLVVPSKETEKWRAFLISNDWLERGYNIQKENNESRIWKRNFLIL